MIKYGNLKPDGKYRLIRDGMTIGEGTVEEISKQTGKGLEELFHYRTPAYKYNDYGYRMIKIS
jgi:hypothetical protein